MTKTGLGVLLSDMGRMTYIQPSIVDGRLITLKYAVKDTKYDNVSPLTDTIRS